MKNEKYLKQSGDVVPYHKPFIISVTLLNAHTGRYILLVSDIAYNYKLLNIHYM